MVPPFGPGPGLLQQPPGPSTLTPTLYRTTLHLSYFVGRSCATNPCVYAYSGNRTRRYELTKTTPPAVSPEHDFLPISGVDARIGWGEGLNGVVDLRRKYGSRQLVYMDAIDAILVLLELLTAVVDLSTALILLLAAVVGLVTAMIVKEKR